MSKRDKWAKAIFLVMATANLTMATGSFLLDRYGIAAVWLSMFLLNARGNMSRCRKCKRLKLHYNLHYAPAQNGIWGYCEPCCVGVAFEDARNTSEDDAHYNKERV